MHKSGWLAFTLGVVLMAGVALADEQSRDGRGAGLEPGTIARGLARLERAVARLEARLAGRSGSMMEGCSDMMMGGGMMGGGMMGGSPPNERWRSSPSR